MGALTAAFSKNGRDIVPTVVRMLAELKHRGSDAHGIATIESTEITGSVQELRSLDLESNAAIGHNLSRVLPRDVPQPVQDRDAKLVFEGRFFPPSVDNEAQEVMKSDGKNAEEKARNIIKMKDGSYVFAFLSDRRIVLGRDSVGLAPLYYSEGDEMYAFASERKALWALGMLNVKSFPPGQVAIADDERLNLQSVRPITKPDTKPISMEDAAERLQSLLMVSTNERILDTRKIALAFSGGLDSTVTAYFARESDVDVQLICVGMEGQPEIEHAENVAEFLDLPLRVKTFVPEDVKEILSRVLWLIEEPDILKVSVALPFYWIAETASNIGLSVLLAGQGSDELFGGYYRYLREYASSGVKGLEDALYYDVASSYEVNFERDNKVCASHRVELRLPFADHDLILFSLGLPANLKIASTRDQLRKRVLREVARRTGLPRTVYNRRKRAIQYTTRIDKVLRKLARKEGLSLKDFIRISFQRSYNREMTSRNE